jgi:predicted GIY-YIG superfamily endonuclease
MVRAETMFTYIIKTRSGEFYCGKTENIKRRMEEHMKESYPHWFCNMNRKIIMELIIIKGDYENKIKRFGTQNMIYVLKNHDIKSPPSW